MVPKPRHGSLGVGTNIEREPADKWFRNRNQVVTAKA